VRQLLGYQRLEQPDLIPLINDLYHTWGLFHNLFCPTLKLCRKVRRGSKTLRTYATPQTPYQRLLDSPHLSPEQKDKLRAQYLKLNPLELKEQIEQKLKRVFDKAHTAQ
jgi:hypothetical protein